MFKRHQPLPSTLPSQPRIAAILSCQNNLMALSWHMPISREPFRYAIAMRKENFTYSLLKEYGCFTLNFLPFAYAEQIDECGRSHGNETDKLATIGLTSSLSDADDNRLIDEADYVYECTIIDTYENGDHTIFIADVTALHLKDIIDGKPTLFLGRGRYTTTI